MNFSEKWNTEKVFQCFDGSVIPKEQLCDGMVDCRGKFEEDEKQCDAHLKTCLDYWKAGFTENREYLMYEDDNGGKGNTKGQLANR